MHVKIFMESLSSSCQRFFVELLYLCGRCVSHVSHSTEILRHTDNLGILGLQYLWLSPLSIALSAVLYACWHIFGVIVELLSTLLLLSFSICSGDVFLMCRILLKFFAKPTIYDFRSSMLLIKSSLDCSWRDFVCMLRYFWSHCRALVNAFLLSFSRDTE